MPPLETKIWATVLSRVQNADGGIPYFEGKESSLEPTALAVLALEIEGDPGRKPHVNQARKYLARRQGKLGRWPIAPGEEIPAWETPLVLLALADDPAYTSTCRAGIHALLRIKADAANPEGITVDPRWRGWNWYPATPGWVEPTSLSILAAQRLRSSVEQQLLRARIEDADHFLMDRMSPDGGWNYGNSYILGRGISPFLASTAMALLALKSMDHEDERIQSAVEFLEKNLLSQPSGFTVSWGVLALIAFGRTVRRARESLLAVWEHDSFLNNLAVLSLALVAMLSRRGSHPFLRSLPEGSHP